MRLAISLKAQSETIPSEILRKLAAAGPIRLGSVHRSRFGNAGRFHLDLDLVTFFVSSRPRVLRHWSTTTAI
jgi:hypothetical protein